MRRAGRPHAEGRGPRADQQTRGGGLQGGAALRARRRHPRRGAGHVHGEQVQGARERRGALGVGAREGWGSGKRARRSHPFFCRGVLRGGRPLRKCACINNTQDKRLYTTCARGSPRASEVCQWSREHCPSRRNLTPRGDASTRARGPSTSRCSSPFFHSCSLHAARLRAARASGARRPHTPPLTEPKTKPNKTQIEIIRNLPADAVITLYRVGPMVDLCSGPHLPSTSLLKAAAVTQASRAFWRADVTKEPLQRVYAISFPDAKQLKEYQHRCGGLGWDARGRGGQGRGLPREWAQLNSRPRSPLLPSPLQPSS